MNLKKRLPLIMVIAAAVSVIGAALLFIFAIPNADATYKKVLEWIIAILLLLMAGLIGYYLWLTRDSDPNFFLFDRAKKKNLSVDELNFKIVNERMNFYLTMVGESAEAIWQGGALEDERKLGYNKVYRPLLAYKMLYDLADKNIDDYWKLLLECSPETLDSLCSALEQAGEAEMVKAFRFIMFNYRQSPEKVKDFVIGNLRYIRGRMLAYIKKNVELFY